MSTFKEQLINSFDSILLALVAIWTISVGSALLQPASHERIGTVEIYSLSPAALIDASTR